ncbi:hypothetical protein RchiOBHm_Chr1g0360061 [Rosa chinensis]|uniref:Uncharacterized protein n=1 Tax=Rosa chinensis TaxID=74649 RepID=A0A2P6SIK5_ROSCH|nr:hypothetical protein RchiOBHm_Chr1g0360061 [Rosa chinensis]
MGCGMSKWEPPPMGCGMSKWEQNHEADLPTKDYCEFSPDRPHHRKVCGQSNNVNKGVDSDDNIKDTDGQSNRLEVRMLSAGLATIV